MTSPIIDAHVHLFPREVCAAREDFCVRDAWFGVTHSSPAVRMASVDDLLDSMDASGVEVAVIAGWPWEDMGLCRMHNDFLAEVCRHNPRLKWLGIVNPAHSESVAEAERVRALGASGIGELNADAQGFCWEDDGTALDKLAQTCDALGIPIMAHLSEPVGRAYPGKGTATPPRILKFIERHPEVSFVAAHWGGGLPFYELMPDLQLLLANVSYDSAASTYLYRPEVFDIVSRIVGHNRIVWGSDFPVLGQRRFLLKAQAHIPQAATSDIFGRNAMRIYDFKTPEERS